MESQLSPPPPPHRLGDVQHTEAGGALLTPWALGETGCGMGRALAGGLGDPDPADCRADPATSA